MSCCKRPVRGGSLDEIAEHLGITTPVVLEERDYKDLYRCCQEGLKCDGRAVGVH